MKNRIYPPWEHEYELRKAVKGLLGGRGGVFIDVGANVGLWVVDFGPLFDRVYAFEPWPEYAEQLRLNVKDYGVGNVEIIEAAAWDFDGQVLIGVGRTDNTVHHNAPGLNVPTVGFQGMLVRSARIDSIVKEPFRMMKIDVEGMAFHVLRGAERLLEVSNGLIVLEVHNHGESHGTYLYLTGLGWKLVKTIEISQGPNWYHAHKVYVK